MIVHYYSQLQNSDFVAEVDLSDQWPSLETFRFQTLNNEPREDLVFAWWRNRLVSGRVYVGLTFFVQIVVDFTTYYMNEFMVVYTDTPSCTCISLS